MNPYRPTEEQTYRNGVNEKLAEILNQVKKTNGRVTKLERWQSYVLGFCACVVIVIVPTLLEMLRLLLR